MITSQTRDDSNSLEQLHQADQTVEPKGCRLYTHDNETSDVKATSCTFTNAKGHPDQAYETEKDFRTRATQVDEAKEENEVPAKQASWSKLKKIVTGVKKHSIRNDLCPGSMTDAERSFLKMLNASSKKLEPETSTPGCGSSQEKNPVSLSFARVVDAAVARDRLRKELQTRLSKLTTKEAQFLKDIVEDEEVTRQQLEKADEVLRTDPLYRLSTEDESFADDFERENSDVSEVILNRGRNLEKKIDNKVSEGILGRDRKSLDVSVRMGDLGLEVFLKGLEHTPSAYSFNTWDRLNSNPQAFPILASLDEISESDRILSPPMIDSLRKFLPYIIAEDNFWLRYSMVRDGSSILNLFNCVRQSSRTLLAIETADGDVFGGFVSSPWRNHNDFYGSCEAFLWRLKSSKFVPCSSMEEQVKMESCIEAFKWSRQNRSVQMSNRSRIVIGGGMPEDGKGKSSESRDWGLGIALDGNLSQGTTSDCVTFSSPPLTNISSKDNIFEISNMEVWSFTPCQHINEAEQLEMGRMFVLSHFESS